MPVTKENFVNPQRWNLYVYVNNNPIASRDPSGSDGEGQGGDKVISVFLMFSKSDRNSNSKGGPGWASIAKVAQENGYKLQVFGSPAVAGKGALEPSGEAFDSALKNSAAVVLVTHGKGPEDSQGNFHQEWIQIGDQAYTATGEGQLVQTVGPNLQPTQGIAYDDPPKKPETNASVVGSFTCASSSAPNYFAFKGEGQQLVTVNSGKEGRTTVGTLERAAAAFVRTYVQGKDGVKAAQNVIQQDRNIVDKKTKLGERPNAGDTVVRRVIN